MTTKRLCLSLSLLSLHLEIAMNDAVVVTVRNALEDLLDAVAETTSRR